MSRLLMSVLTLGSRAALLVAPAAFRRRAEEEIRQTFIDVCLASAAEGGFLAMASTGLREILNQLHTAVQARLGRVATVQPPAWKGRGSGHRGSIGRTLVHDVRMGIRMLMVSRAYSLPAVLTLALGIGMTSAAFSVLDSLIFRPLPFASSDRLVELWNQRQPSGVQYPRVDRALFLEWRKQTDLFDRMEGFEVSSSIWKSPRGAEMVPAAFVTPGLFSLLGVPPLEGRLFADGDGRDGSDGLVVISERFWRDRLGRAPGVVGRTLTLNGATHTVIGIMPASFRFPNQAQVIWLPIDPAAPPASRVNGLMLATFGRIAAGVSPDTIEARVESRAPRVLEAVGEFKDGLSTVVQNRNKLVNDSVRQSLTVLAVAVGFVLLIVCANVANLSLSQALTRSRDFAVRASLGASRLDLIRQTLVENALVGTGGVVLGLLVGWVVLQGAMASLPASMFFSSLNEVDLDTRAVVFTTLVGMTTVLLFGLPPAVIASRPAIVRVLRDDARSAAGSRRSRRVRSLLVVVEVAVSIVLLVGAALMARSFAKLQAVDRGFDASRLAVARVGLPATGYRDAREQDRFTERVLTSFAQLPGVQAATAGSVPPDSDLVSFGNLEFEHAPGTVAEQVIVPIYRVWPDYFSTTGIPLVDGRPFGPDEPRESTIISRSFAEKFWPERSAVGGRFRFTGGSSWRVVVGVAGEVRQLDMNDATGSFEFYYPMRVSPGPSASNLSRPSTDAIVAYRTFVVRASDPGAVISDMRQTISRLDDNVVIWDAHTVEDNFSAAIARPRVVLFMLALFAALGLALAAAGLYGVLSYLVGQRRKEIGIRLALGAAPGQIFGLVLRSGLVLTATGLVAGVVLALGLGRLMRTLLYEVEPVDPVSILMVAGLLAVTAMAASWRPAGRAMRVDPVSLLRQD